MCIRDRLYILPWLVGFLLFKVYPFASSLYYSFTNYDLFNGITKTGLLNYEKIFTDEDIIRAFVVTFKYAIFDVPLKPVSYTHLDVYKRQYTCCVKQIIAKKCVNMRFLLECTRKAAGV